MKNGALNRNDGLDALKICLAIMIIGIHTSFFSNVNQLYNHILIQGVFRIAVPMFFIINGFYFSNIIKKRKLHKWYAKILPLYFFWMFLYSPFWFFDQDLTFAQTIKRLIMGYYHLWYIPAMVGAATTLYYLSRWVSTLKIFYIAMSLFVIGVVFQYLKNFDLISLPFRNVLFFGIPFFFIGYLMNFIDISFFSRKKLLTLLVTSVFFIVLESYLTLIFVDVGVNWDLLFSLMFISPIIFLLFLKGNYALSTKNLAHYSSGLYFIHPLILKYFEFISFGNSLLIAIYTVLVCLLITWFLTTHIKITRYLL